MANKDIYAVVASPSIQTGYHDRKKTGETKIVQPKILSSSGTVVGDGIYLTTFSKSLNQN